MTRDDKLDTEGLTLLTDAIYEVLTERGATRVQGVLVLAGLLIAHSLQQGLRKAELLDWIGKLWDDMEAPFEHYQAGGLQ